MADQSSASSGALFLLKENMQNNVDQLCVVIDGHERFRELFVGGVTERSALESYQLLKERFTVGGGVYFADMFKMLDECLVLMDKQEAVNRGSIGEPFVGDDLSLTSNSDKIAAFMDSRGYKECSASDIEEPKGLRGLSRD